MDGEIKTEAKQKLLALGRNQSSAFIDWAIEEIASARPETFSVTGR